MLASSSFSRAMANEIPAGRYRHVHAIAARSLVGLGLGLRLRSAVSVSIVFFLLSITAFTVKGQETC